MDVARRIPEEAGEIGALFLVEGCGGAEEKIVLGEIEVQLGLIL